jgi:hypothetical protein
VVSRCFAIILILIFAPAVSQETTVVLIFNLAPAYEPPRNLESLKRFHVEQSSKRKGARLAEISMQSY